MNLVIVESPAKAKTINKYLGSDFKVISSYGHIRGIPSRIGAVHFETKDFKVDYEIQAKSDKVLHDIISSSKKSDAIYLATDPDREGEAISWHISEILASNIPNIESKIKRITFQEVTKTAIKKAVANPRKINMDLVHAQQARQALDYLVGFTLSPILWRKLPGSRSAGRVQSVALRLICEREKEVRAFKVEEYWTIDAEFLVDDKNNQDESIIAKLTVFDGKKLDKMSINNQATAEKILATVIDGNYFVVDQTKKDIQRSPQPPFTTSTLIQDASSKLGFSAARTSKTAQKLYEGVDIDGELVGLITYMRTDSVSISPEAIESARSFISSKYGPNYLPASKRVFKNKSKNAQEAHEAIRPTNVALSPSRVKNHLPSDQYDLYELIWKRFIASQMNNAILESTTVLISATKNSKEAGIFSASGSVVKFPGFYAVYQPLAVKSSNKSENNSESDRIMPSLAISQEIIAKKIEKNKHETKPPARYTEASLVKKMEELGIGRPSTYPSIIETLRKRSYVEEGEKRRFVPSVRGEVVSAFLTNFFNNYVCYDFTAELEQNLDKIAHGDETYVHVLQGFWGGFHEISDQVIHMDRIEIMQKIEDILHEYLFHENGTSCPQCKQGHLSLRTGKSGCFIGCSAYPDCNYLRNVGVTIGGDSVELPSVDEKYPKHITTDPATNKEITLNKGPYGIYLRLGEAGDKKGKNVKVPASIPLDKLTTELALALVSLPKVIGIHQDTGLEIKLGVGMYGPYVLHDGQFVSIRKPDFLNLTVEEAIEAINLKNSKIAKGGKNPRFKSKSATKTKAESINKSIAKKSSKTQNKSLKPSSYMKKAKTTS